jgi:REP element-mobilizing transposase RayT
MKEWQSLAHTNWTRSYCVSTVGLNEKQVREYISKQEKREMGEQGYLDF